MNTYPYGLGTVSVSAPASAEGYMAGETVTLTVIPDEGSRLVKKDAILGSYSIGNEYYNVAFTKVDATTYTFVMPHGNVHIEVFYEIAPAVAPGGTVVDNDTLIAALGGAENAALNAETGAVQLLQDVELLSPILFNPTEATAFILDLNGKRIIAVEENAEESGAIILHQNGLAQLTLEDSSGYGVITTDGLPRNYFHTIWVRGGKLIVEPQKYITINGAHAYYKNSAAGIRVVGGEVEIKNDRLSVCAQCAGDGLWASGGTTVIHGGTYSGGCDYYNEMAGQLGLLGGVEDYSWVTNRSLGGSGIRFTGSAKMEITNAQAIGGPNSAALYVDAVVVDKPGELNVYGGTYHGEYGKGLLVQSAYSNVTIYGGTFYAGYPSNADYSVDVRNCGVVADYLAPHRKVENLDRYLGYDENYNSIYEEMSEEDLQRSYLYDNIRVSDGPAGLVNGALDSVLETLPETITPEDIADIQNAVSEMEGLETALEADKPDSSTSTVEKLEAIEAVIGEATIRVDNDNFAIEGAESAIVGAAINAGGDVTLNVGEAQVEEKAEVPADYQSVQHFSLELVAGEEEITQTTPVKVILPVPENVNPALLMILHYNEQDQAWETIVPYVYQQGTQWYMTFVANSFSDFAVTHKVSVMKDSYNGGVWATLDVYQAAAENQQFLCAVYNEQGQMLGVQPVSGDTFVRLGDKTTDAYEVKVFTTTANGSWQPLFGEETILLENTAN